MQSFKMYAPCLFGVEGILADELKRLGAEQVQAQNGRVCFSGSLQTLAAANLGLRTAERVLIEVGSFTATTFTELFDGVKALPWRQYLTKTDSFPVTGYSISSQLHSLPDCQAIIKKAVVESLRGAYGGDWFEESGPTKKIRFSIQKNRVTVGIDTSGAGLHKRGYREHSATAPIKETLAAALCYLTGIYPDTQLYDPFCGRAFWRAVCQGVCRPACRLPCRCKTRGRIPRLWQRHFARGRCPNPKKCPAGRGGGACYRHRSRC